MTKPLNSINCPGIFRAVEQLYVDGDPLAAMLLLGDLCDLGLKHGLVEEADLVILSHLREILGEVARQREADARMPF